MSVRVKLPPILQESSGGVEAAEAAGRTVGECLESLEKRFPGIKESCSTGRVSSCASSVSILMPTVFAP